MYEVSVPNPTNIASFTDVEIASITVPAGVYMISSTLFYPTPNGAGFRQISLNTGGHTRTIPNTTDLVILNVSDISQLSTPTAIKLYTYQTSGTTLSVNGTLRVVRIK